jgi:protein-S-isoprenylcysteine O-methyltransferase Ste14
MARAIYLLFGVVAYLIFFATFLYLVAFVGNLPGAPLTVDAGGPLRPLWHALLADVGLIVLFGLQHSVMARQGFKRAWTRIVPTQAERSTYVLFASLALIVLFMFWRPIGGEVWNFTNPVLALILMALFWMGWATVLVSTFLINHFELFGLQQAWLYARGREPAPHELREPLFYRWVRHPIYAGFFLAFWATPQMTMGHLLLAAGMSVYMLIAIRYEERDLIGMYGQGYEDYRSRVGMLTPRFRRRQT